jgi:hypothetical protein
MDFRYLSFDNECLRSSDDLGVTELNPSKRGRKTLLDEKLDSQVQFFSMLIPV